MNPSVEISNQLPLEIYQYKRPGGSVSHTALDLLVSFGCSSIALIGQDLAYSKDDVYIDSAATHKKGDNVTEQKFGKDIEVKGFDGKPVVTNNVFLQFAKLFSIFAEELYEKDVKLFNCTEGGLFVAGFNHCKLETFFENECCQSIEKKLAEILEKQKISGSTDRKSQENH